MKNKNRFTLDIIGIGVIIFIVIASFGFVWFRENDPARIRGSIYNQDKDGTSLFYNWLIQQQYQAEPISVLTSLYRYPQGTIFILNSQGDYTSEELIDLDIWVQNGGTAVIALESNQSRQLTKQFNTKIKWIWPAINNSQPKLPLLNWPNIITEANLRANHKVSISCGRAAIHIGSCRRPILTSFGHGNGQIYFLSTVHIFTNDGIQNEENAHLVENIIYNTASRGSNLLFDEGHRQQSSLWFLTHPVGWAIFLMLLCVTLFLLWHSSKSKIKPVDVMTDPQLSEMQESVQYLNKVAEAEKTTQGANAIKTHYWQRLKRTLCQRYRLDPSVSDENFLVEIKPYLDDSDMAEIISLHIRKERDQMAEDLALRTWTESMIQITEKHQPASRQIY